MESLERSLVNALSGDDARDRDAAPSPTSTTPRVSAPRRAAARDEKAEEKRGNSLQVDKGLASTNVQTSALAAATAAPLGGGGGGVGVGGQARSASPTPSSPPPASPVPHSPQTPAAPFFFFAPTPRTAADDVFFARCHDLPWTVELTAEWPNGRVVLLPTDCYLLSSPYELPPNTEADDDAAPPAIHPLRLFLHCTLLDSHGLPAAHRADAHCTLRARVSLGGGQSGRFDPADITRPNSAASSTLSTPTSQSRGLASPFRTPSATSSPRGSPSPHLPPHLTGGVGSLGALPPMGEHDSHVDDREWMKAYFALPQPEHVCRPATRQRAALDTQPPLAVSAGGGTGGWGAGKGALWTVTKEDDRCRWAFTLAPAALPPAPRRERAGVRGGKGASTSIGCWRG